jgi:hypothetical protein
MISRGEIEKMCEIIQLVLCKKGWIEAFNEKFPRAVEIVRNERAKVASKKMDIIKGGFIEHIVMLLISELDLRVGDLQIFMYNITLEKMMKPKSVKLHPAHSHESKEESKVPL